MYLCSQKQWAMKIQLVFCAVCLWLLAACRHDHNPQMDALLNRAEALMTEHPDSAFSLLESMHESMPKDEAYQARYAVLFTRAANKTYQSLTEPPYDSLMHIALQTYSKASKERAIALLYRGRIRVEQQRWQEAMTDLQEAYRLIQSYPKEDEYHRHILSSLSGIYQVLGYDEEAMTATKELSTYCTTDIDRSVALSQIGDFYNNREMPDSALHYQRLAYNLAQQAGDENLSRMYAHRLGYIYLYLERYDLALAYLNEPQHPVYLDGRIGEAFYYNGQIDSAYQCLLRYVESDLQSKEIEPYRLLYEVEKQRGNLAEAYRHLEASTLLADSLASTIDNSGDIASVMAAHREEMATQMQQAKSKEERIWLIAGFLGLTLLAYAVYQHRLRQKDRKLKDTIDRLLEKDRIIFDSQQQLEEYGRSIAGLKEEKRTLQHWLITQTPIYKRVEKLAEQDFSNPAQCKVLSFNEQKSLKSALYTICTGYVDELKKNHPKLEEDDIFLLCLEKYTNFDANTIALCFGTTSKHTINQRRYRMKDRLTIEKRAL